MESAQIRARIRIKSLMRWRPPRTAGRFPILTSREPKDETLRSRRRIAENGCSAASRRAGMARLPRFMPDANCSIAMEAASLPFAANSLRRMELACVTNRLRSNRAPQWTGLREHSASSIGFEDAVLGGEPFASRSKEAACRSHRRNSAPPAAPAGLNPRCPKDTVALNPASGWLAPSALLRAAGSVPSRSCLRSLPHARSRSVRAAPVRHSAPASLEPKRPR